LPRSSPSLSKPVAGFGDASSSSGPHPSRTLSVVVLFYLFAALFARPLLFFFVVVVLVLVLFSALFSALFSVLLRRPLRRPPLRFSRSLCLLPVLFLWGRRCASGCRAATKSRRRSAVPPDRARLSGRSQLRADDRASERASESTEERERESESDEDDDDAEDDEEERDVDVEGDNDQIERRRRGRPTLRRSPGGPAQLT